MARAIQRLLGVVAGGPWVAMLSSAVVAGAAVWGLVAFHDHGVRQGRDEVQATIDRPVTGWAARLATCQANNATLDAGLIRQNTELNAKRDADAKRLAEAADAVTKASAQSRDTARQVAALTAPLKGPDTCARMLEVDGRVKEMFK